MSVSAQNHPSSERLDTYYQVETPEGIDLTLRPAGFFARGIAFAIDLIIRGLLMLALGILLLFLDKFGKGLMLIFFFLVNWWYMVLFEVLNQGRSPGKQLLGLRVVHADGTPIGWGASLTRNLLRFVDMLPVAYSVGLICCLSNKTFKRLGDLAAGTLVVYRETTPKAPELPQVPPIPSPIRFSLLEQRAVIGFAERHQHLSQARRDELAAILAQPLNCAPDQAEQELHGIARGLIGQS